MTTPLALIQQRKEVTAGDVRKHLGAAFDPRHDPGYAALAELMDLGDNDLLDLVMRRTQSPDAQLQAMLEKLRTA